MGTASGGSTGVYISLETIYREVQGLREDVRGALHLEDRVRTLEEHIRTLEALRATPPSPPAQHAGGGVLTPTTAVAALLTALGTVAYQVLGGG